MSTNSSNVEDLELYLSESSSSFDEDDFLQHDIEEREPDEEENFGLLPYQFEPLLDEGAIVPAAHGDGEANVAEMQAGRINNVDWCSCGSCVAMPTALESKCCREIQEVCERRTEMEADPPCITHHEGFQPVCLNKHVLRVSYYQYRQQFGEGDGQEIHEQYRYTAYRQFVRWCWGFLWRHVRVVIPACAVHKIREAFPSQDFAGFQYPMLD